MNKFKKNDISAVYQFNNLIQLKLGKERFSRIFLLKNDSLCELLNLNLFYDSSCKSSFEKAYYYKYKDNNKIELTNKIIDAKYINDYVILLYTHLCDEYQNNYFESYRGTALIIYDIKTKTIIKSPSVIYP